jgi:hypothetical protein
VYLSVGGCAKRKMVIKKERCDKRVFFMAKQFVKIEGRLKPEDKTFTI